MDDPCLTCQTQVRGRQQAVECDWCHRWQHRKCGTGISQSAYREAVKLGGLSFVCRPCRDSEIAPPTLELSVIEQNPRDTSLEEPPILEISIPVTRNKGDKFTEDTVIDDIHEQVLRSLLAKVGECSVEGFVLDFETAAWRAIREVFSNIEVKGCAFHWTQAVWRHVQQVGLAETYRNRLGMHKFIRMLLSLQFLPAEHIVPTFEKMAERATTEPTHQLTAYMRRQWIESTVFPVKDWSVYRQLIRTNNDVEGWHHRMNNKAGGGLKFLQVGTPFET